MTEATLSVGLDDTGLPRRGADPASRSAWPAARSRPSRSSRSSARMIKKPGDQLLHTLFRPNKKHVPEPAAGAARLRRLAPGQPERPRARRHRHRVPGRARGGRRLRRPDLGVVPDPAHPAAARARRSSRARVRPASAGRGRPEYVAFSKICTHAGCPASLYEQQTTRLLCPCHQSQFEVLAGRQAGVRPGHPQPAQAAARRRDRRGRHSSTSSPRHDYHEPIGPGFWERP